MRSFGPNRNVAYNF
jgi:hypothetical protein